MTELYIDGVQVVLPSDMSTEVKRENQFFTKNGEYTYDITLYLNNSVNRELYSHINRQNIATIPSSKRTAVLIADHRVFCNGTEIITAWTDETVTIQVASGNSELNYFIGSDLMISSLELCSDSPFSHAVPVKDMVTKLYPDIEACLAPVYDRTAGYMYNEWLLNKISATGNYELNSVSSPSEYDYISQPFLCAFIKKLLGAIGYTLTENSLESSVFKDLFICHVNPIREWGKMLPGWSVQDFLEEIENLFNASFVIDSKKKTVKLLFNNSYYLNVELRHIQQVIDEYEGEKVDKSDSSLSKNANIKYSFPDNSYYRHRALSSYVIKKATYVTIPKEYAQEIINLGLDYLYFWFSDANNQDKNKIYKDELTGREYLFKNVTGGNIVSIPVYELINEFAAIERDEASSEIELSMMPVELSAWKLYTYTDGVKVEGTSTVYYVPTIDSSDSSTTGEETENSDLDTLITDGTSETTESKAEIFLAFHRGLNNVYPTYLPKNAYPMSFTDEFIPDFYSMPVKANTDGATLRLAKLDELLYSGVYDIDEENKITITSYDPNVYDTRGVFVINHKKYVCRVTTFTLTAEGRKKAWTGEFYPIKISDTETYQRWILADGKWRDGGAWLDNGRWLDE